MDNYGNDYFMSQEGYASIDFTLLDRPNSNIASAPESTAALLPDLHVTDSSFASFDFLDAPNVDAFGGVLPDEAHSRDQGGYRFDQQKKTKERSLLQQSSVGLHRGDGDADSELPSSEFHIPFEVQKPISNLDFFSQGHTKESGHQEQQAPSDPGNDATDGNHDYFEQGHMAQQAHNAAGAGGWYNSWPGSNSQGDQTQVFLQTPSYEEASDERRLMQMKGNAAQLAGQMAYQSPQVPSSDSVPKATHSFLQTTHAFLPTAKQNDSRQASNVGLGLPSAQVNAANSSVVKNSSRHQAYDYEGLMNGASANQFRQNSSVENTSSARRHHSSDASVGGQDALRVHAQSQSYKYPGQNLGAMAQIEVSPLKVNDYDFLGGQYAMKGQTQGNEIGQQLAVDEMQAWHQHPLLSQSNQQQASYQQSYQDLPRQQQQHHVDQQSQSTRQQHVQQFLAANHQNQSLGNQLSAFLSESSLQDIPRVPERQNSQLAVENPRALLQTSYPATNNATNVNWSAADPSAMEGLAHDYLMGADQNFNWQALALKASQVGPNAYGSLPVTRRDTTGQASGGTYPAMQGGFQDYYAGSGKLTPANAQVEKPVARNLGAEGSGGSIYGSAYQTTEVYDTTASLHASAQSSKHQAIGKLPFWQNPYPQTVEANRSSNSLGQTNLPPRSPQLPTAAQGRQQSSWSGLSGQQETLHGGIFAQNLANAEALKQSLLAGSSIQQTSHQAADLRPSARNQSIEAAHYLQQSSTQTASSSHFLNALGAKQSNWNRLNMQQNVPQTGVSAETPSTLEANQKNNWTSLNIQQASAETQPLANLKQQNLWGGHTAQRSRPAANSLHLFTDMDARRSGMQNSHELQQGSAQPSGAQQVGKIDVNLQSSHNIQSSSVQGNEPPNTLLDLETSQQSGWRDHSLLQGANQTNSSIQGYNDLDKTSSWRSIWQTPSSGEASSQLLEMDDGRQQNTLWGHSLQKSRPEPVESHVTAINSREQSAWGAQDVQQESPQTNQLLSSLEAEQQQGSHHAHTLGDRHQSGQFGHLLHEERPHSKTSAEVDARHNATQSVYSLQSQVAATEQDVRQKAIQNAYNLQSQVGMTETDTRHKGNQDVYSLQTQIRVGEADNRSKSNVSAYNLQAQLASAEADARHRASQQNSYTLQAQVAMGETDVRHKANQNIYNLQSQVGLGEKDSRLRGSQNVYNLQSQVGSVEIDAQHKARQNAYNLQSQLVSAEAEARLKASQNAYSLQAQVGAYSQTSNMDGRHGRAQWPLGSQQQGNSQAGTSMFGFPSRSGKNQGSQNSANLQAWNAPVGHVEGWQKSGTGGSSPFQQADLIQVENVDSRQQNAQSVSNSRHSSPQSENHLQSLSSSRPPSRLGRPNNSLDSSLSGAMGATAVKLASVNHWQNHNKTTSSNNSQSDVLPSWSQGHASPARGDVEKFSAAGNSAGGSGDVFPQWSRGQSLHSQQDVEQVNLVGESSSAPNEVLPTWSRAQNSAARKDVEHAILGGESRIRTNESQRTWSSGQNRLAQNNVEESSSGLNEASTTWSRQQNVPARKTVEQPNLGELNNEMNENDLPAWSRGQSVYTRKDEDELDGGEESNKATEELPIWSRGQNKSARSVVDQLDLGEDSNSGRNEVLPAWSRGQTTAAMKDTEQSNLPDETNSGSDFVPTWSRGQSAPAVSDAEELHVDAESNIGKPDASPAWSQGQHVLSRNDDEQLNHAGDPNSGGTNISVKESLIARPEAEKRAQAEMSFLDRGTLRESNSGASPAPSPESNLFSSSAKQKPSTKTSSLSRFLNEPYPRSMDTKRTMRRIRTRNTLELLSRPEEPNESSSMHDEEVEEEELDLEDSGANALGISLAHLRRPGQPSGPLSPQGFGLRLAPPSHLSQRGDPSRMVHTQPGQELPQSNSNSENDQALNEKVDPSIPSEVGTSDLAPATSTGTDAPANSQPDSHPISQEHVPAEIIEHTSMPSSQLDGSRSQPATLSSASANAGVHQAFLDGRHSADSGQQGLDSAPTQGMDPMVSEDGNGTSNSFGSSQANVMGHLTSSLPHKAQHSSTNLQVQSGGVQTAGLSKLLNTFKDSLAGQNKQVSGQQQAGNVERGNTGVFESFRPQLGKQVNGLQPGQWGTVFQRLAAQVQNKPNQTSFGQMQPNDSLEQAATGSESFSGKTGAVGHYFSGQGFSQGQIFSGQATSSGQLQPGQPLHQVQTVPGQESTAASPHPGQIYHQGYGQPVQGISMDNSHQGYLQAQSHTIQGQGMLPDQHSMVPSQNLSAQVSTPGQSYPGQAYAPGQVLPGQLNPAGRSYPGQTYNSSQVHAALGSVPGKSFSQSQNYSVQSVTPGQALPGPETPGQPISGHIMSPAMASKQSKARQNRKFPQKAAGNDTNQTPMRGGYPAQQSTGFQSQQSPAQSISLEHQYGPMVQQRELSASVQASQEETPSDARPDSLVAPEGLGVKDAKDGDSRGLGGTEKSGAVPARVEGIDSMHAPPRSGLEQYGVRPDQSTMLQQWQNAQTMNSQSVLSDHQFQRILEARPSLTAALDAYKGDPRLYQLAIAQLRASLNAAHSARLAQYQKQVRDQQAVSASTGAVRIPSDGSAAAQAVQASHVAHAQAAQAAQAAHAQAQSMHASQAAHVHAAAQAVEAYQAAQAAQKAQAVQAPQAMHSAQGAQSGQTADQAAQAVQAAIMSKNANNAQAAQAARLQYLSQLAQRGQNVNGMAGPWYSGMVGRPGSNGPLVASRMVEGMGQDPTAASAPFGVGNDGLSGNRFLPNSHVPPPQPKKRKEAPALPPWREVISQAGGYVSNMSGSELEWAAATNRIPEVESRDENVDVMDSRAVIISRAKRRLRLTTQLMQQITPAVPATFMQSKSIEDRESSSYTLSKLAFADACRISSIARRIREVAAARDAEESRIEKERELAMKEAEKTGENTGRPLPLPTNIADRFKLRMKLLENDLQRLENSPSAVDLVKDMQDTERISLVNRLAVHHTPLYSPQNLDSPIRAVPQKHATAVHMPSKLPEGLLCVSL